MPLKLILLSAIFGFTYLLTVFFLLKAFTMGSMGGSTLFCNTGIFFSSFYGILRFGDDFTLQIALGMILLFLAVLLSMPKESTKQKNDFKWFVFALLSGLCNGIVSSVKREAVTLYPDGAINFLLWGFAFAAITALIFLCLKNENKKDAISVVKKPYLLMCGILAGIGTAGANLFQMLALKYVSSAIIYPLTSGFLVVSLWFISYVYYKETKLTKSNVIAIIYCVAAIILVNIK